MKRLLTLADLTPKQAAFVELFVENPNGDMADMVFAAGYECQSRSVASSVASNLKRDPKVLEVIRALAEARFKASAIAATKFLEDVVNDQVGTPVKTSDRIRAAERILDQAGLMIVNRSEIDVNHNDNRTMLELQAAVKKKLETLGAQVPAVLLTGPKPIDAEFEQVDPAAPYGRRYDEKRPQQNGMARKKPGRKPWKQRLITKEGAIPDYYETQADKRNREHKERVFAKAKALAERKLQRAAERQVQKEMDDADN